MNAQLETDFAKLHKAMLRLQEVYAWSDDHDGRVEASIQCFEFVVELYWKLLKHMLRLKEIIVSTPRDVFKEAFAAGWLDDEDVWVKMLKDRNLSSHTYNEDLAHEILERMATYLPIIQTTFDKIKRLAETF